jgi:hypothetical protein
MAMPAADARKRDEKRPSLFGPAAFLARKARERQNFLEDFLNCGPDSGLSFVERVKGEQSGPPPTFLEDVMKHHLLTIYRRDDHAFHRVRSDALVPMTENQSSNGTTVAASPTLR